MLTSEGLTHFDVPDFTTMVDILHGNPLVEHHALPVVDIAPPPVLLFGHHGRATHPKQIKHFLAEAGKTWGLLTKCNRQFGTELHGRIFKI